MLMLWCWWCWFLLLFSSFWLGCICCCFGGRVLRRKRKKPNAPLPVKPLRTQLPDFMCFFKKFQMYFYCPDLPGASFKGKGPASLIPRSLPPVTPQALTPSHTSGAYAQSHLRPLRPVTPQALTPSHSSGPLNITACGKRRAEISVNCWQG